MNSARTLLIGLGLILLAEITFGVTPTTTEFQACNAWSENVFSTGSNTLKKAWMKVLQEDVPDSVTRGRSWRGTPYRIGKKTYAHGIAFNSTKHILVHSDRAVQKFTAEIGLENNDDTQRGAAMGNGSVTFQVLVGGKETYASPVMRLQDGAKLLEVPLNGALDFELRVGDGGDGRGWDQALWAEALVTLTDGSILRLQDLPFQRDSGSSNPYAFSFTFNAHQSASALARWHSRILEDKGVDRTLRKMWWQEPGSGLEVCAEATLFADFPAVEWVLQFSNHSSSNSPIIENVQALDSILPVPVAGDLLLHWAKGGVATFDDFAPQSMALKPGASHALLSGEGRSSSQVLPFFNLEGAGSGAVVGIGWSGEWAADFVLSPARELSIKTGLQKTRFYLEGGESIRTPRILVLFYEGDRLRGQNLLRQFLLAHHRPKVRGKPLVAPITCGNWGATRAEVHLDNIQQILKHQLPIDYYWIDAEWYGNGAWPVNVGNWKVKADLYPDGFKPLSNALRSSGRELMLWFEPERVFKGTPWHKEHPEWLLDVGGDNFLFNLGNLEARKFLTDFISARIEDFGLGCYRQDFNIDPLPFWRAADAPDRQGITEMKYIEGLYGFWDELLRRHPALLIDNCASGGRRIDLETVGRATPFWRTDGPRDAIAHQCHSYGLLQWVPLSATSQDRVRDDYEFRSSMCSSLCLNWWVSGDAPAERIPNSFPFDWAGKTLRLYLSLRDCYYGDFYPLTSYSQASDLWMAYQLDQPKSGKGIIIVLKRPHSPYESARFRLCAVEPTATYAVKNADTGWQGSMSGSQMLNEGLQVVIESKPGSQLLFYERN